MSRKTKITESVEKDDIVLTSTPGPTLTSSGVVDVTYKETHKTKTVEDTTPTDASCSSLGKLFANRWEFWTLLVISIIAALITWWIAGTKDANNYWKSLTKVSWADNVWVLAVFQLIALILLGWATFLAGVNSNGFNATLVYVTYGLQIILMIVAFAVLYRQKQPYVAFFFCLALVIVSVWQFYLFMQSGSQASVWILILYVIWLLIITFLAWNIYSSNP